ncbi:nuclear transport factor 2 family protein [Halomicroarcula sp. GCM10025817]|uniref:nuclear transport factor 2 family protein n=1 Tax=Haloarcula TaxID=2237 RepID=UPI0023E7C1AB|nr:nuclear transport factor 2 family protein [Halomicroarcula sp. SYNS111]
MTARETVRAYYAALRAGDPLGRFFADARTGDDPVVKAGISERLVGTDAVREGLRTQTATTTDWTVESEALRVTDRERHAWFGDLVRLGWNDLARDAAYDLETRWSGTLERRPAASDGPGDWRFVGMHVSTARAL